MAAEIRIVNGEEAVDLLPMYILSVKNRRMDRWIEASENFGTCCVHSISVVAIRFLHF